jgi:signal transduction histidine kinase
MKRQRLARLAWVALALMACVIVMAVSVSVAAGEGVDPFPIAMLAFPVVGALIVSRRPGNAIGWIMLGVGIISVVNEALHAYIKYTLTIEPGSLPRPDLALSVSAPMWVPLFGLMGTFVILLFPDGRLPSPRWRPWAWLCAFSMISSFVGILISPDAFDHPTISNPLAIEAPRPFLDATALVLLLIPISIVGCAVGLIRRFRRSSGQERLQLKWLSAGAGATATVYLCAMVPSVILDLPWDGTGPTWLSILQEVAALSFVLIPVAVGIAILRHRLYDIDVVINKTLVFGALAAFITAVYVGVVVGIGTALGTTGGSRLELSIAATALVAVAFQPVRERVQRFANRLVYGERATPYEVMSDFTHSVAAVLSVEDVLPRMAEAAAAGLGAARTRVSVSLENGLSREAVWPEDANGGFDTSLEITHRGEKVGEIAIAKPPGEPLRPTERALLNDLASQAGIALHNARLALQLQARLDEISRQAHDLAKSRERIVTAADTTRRRIERAINRGPERRLEAMSAYLGEAEGALDTDPRRSTELLEALQSEANATLQTLRDLARGIYPPLLAEKGLVAALGSYVRRSESPVELHFSPGLDEIRYDQAIETAVYFCTLEALNNVFLHAPGATAVVSLEYSDRDLMFRVEDDGLGFDAERVVPGSGQHAMVDRVEAFSSSSGPNSDLGMNAAAPALSARDPSSSVS